tara:strand:+ start:43045 stop:43989 length:945 start_codon:yes stop_codon:yes gene_type:complete
MITFEEKLVRAVERKRKAEGLSIRGLSAAVGISFSTLARIERREGQPDNNSKVRLIQWLGPDAESAGLRFDNVASVHFRAAKNVQSTTVQLLIGAADSIRESMAGSKSWADYIEPEENTASGSVSLSKEELEQEAADFRSDLKLSPGEPLDSLRIEVGGVTVIPISSTDLVSSKTKKHLRGGASDEWSAMSVPLDSENENWAVLLNDDQSVERQRVTILEEYWHILLGHKLTKVARISESYGRTYDKSEEHDAFYLASATLLPKDAVIDAVKQGQSSENIAAHFGTSPELVDYRIKRLGLWREHTGKTVRLAPH